LSLLITVVAFIVTLGILVVIHELGHYWIARRCGVKVLRFSVGFGRPLLRWVRGPDKTEWVIAAVPLGGYVRMLDERDIDAGPIDPQDLPRAFNRQSVAKRIAIVVAGPLANLLLAVLVYWSLNVTGTEEPKAIVAPPAAGSMAERAGLRGGDLILAVEDDAVRSWYEFSWMLLRAGLDRGSATVTVERTTGEHQQVQLDLSSLRNADGNTNPLPAIGVALNAGPAVVGDIAPASPAEEAGLQRGDRVLEIGRRPISSAQALIEIVRASEGRPLEFLIEREGQQRGLTITPRLLADANKVSAMRIGAALQEKPDMTVVRYDVLESIPRAIGRTWDTVTFSLQMFWKMLTGQASLKNLSGPVTIADYAGKTAQISLSAYLAFLAAVSIGLGVLNLLPIPVLDGGHLLYYLIEIFKGSPPSDRIVEWGQRAGISMLLALTALALYNDLMRLLT
jgi:regulator of sigma E protease